MSNSLSAAQVQALKKAGYSPAKIRQLQLDTIDSMSRQGMLQVLQNVSKTPQFTPGPVSGPYVFGPSSQLSSPPGMNSGPGITLSQPATGLGGLGSRDIYEGRRSVAPPGYNTSQGTYSSTLPYGVYESAASKPFDLSQTKGGTEYNSFGGPINTNIGSDANPFPPGYVPFTPGGKGDLPPTDQALPGFPDLGPVNIPVVSPRDFTPQGQEIAGTVSAPILAQLAQNKTNISETGKENRQILSGLYSGLVNDIAKSAAESSQQYAGQKNETGQRGQALQQDIAGGYQSSNQELGNIAKSLGIEAAAPQAVQQSAADEAWQKSMAAQGTNAMQDYLGEQQQSEANLNTARQDTARTSGQVAQENNLNDVANALAGVDAQTAQQKSDQARMAIDIAQNLSGQDLSAQGTNAGLSMQGQGMNRDTALQQYRAQLDATNAANSSAHQRWQDAETTKQQRIVNEREDRKLDLDIKAAEAKNMPGQTLDLNDYSGIAKKKASLYNQYGQLGNDLFDLVTNQATQSMGPATDNMEMFMQDLFKHKGNFTDDQLRNAAYTVWEDIRKKSN